MRTSDVTSPLTYERVREQPHWLASHEPYTNPQVVRRAYDAGRPGWAGFAAARPEPAMPDSLPENRIEGVLVDDIAVFLRQMFHEGG